MDKKKYNLFLDDDPRRIPHQLPWISLPNVEWVIVRNYNEFIEIITKEGLPEVISFDHDLDQTAYDEYFRAESTDHIINYNNIKEKTGYHTAKWLANHCITNNIDIPQYYIHTRNSYGHMNIFFILETARKIINKNAKDKV